MNNSTPVEPTIMIEPTESGALQDLLLHSIINNAIWGNFGHMEEKNYTKRTRLFLDKRFSQDVSRYFVRSFSVLTSKLEVDPLRGRKHIKSGSMIVKLDRLTNSLQDRFISVSYTHLPLQTKAKE